MWKCVNCGYKLSDHRFQNIFTKEGSVKHNCLNGKFHSKMVYIGGKE